MSKSDVDRPATIAHPLNRVPINVMRIILAPMEGVVDCEMRDVLTRVGGYDRCVTEFVRVTEQIIPNHVYFRYSPELKQGGLTPSGVPVFVQLLGGSTKYMGLNAARLQKLAPSGIDLNFGCPSKTVNRSDGGSVLLREPQRVGEIIKSVRDSVDPSIPVTAKIRLGFNNHDALLEIAQRVEEAGASELCIHARTRDDRYKPPAYWHLVKKVHDALSIPVIINGEIWSPEDATRAMNQSACADLMLGRGALTCPDLAKQIKAGQNHTPMVWQQTVEMLTRYLHCSENKHPLFVSNRAKQWLVFLQMHYPQAKPLFARIKRLKDAQQVFSVLQSCLTEH